jgi:hypothetical protein
MNYAVVREKHGEHWLHVIKANSSQAHTSENQLNTWSRNVRMSLSRVERNAAEERHGSRHVSGPHQCPYKLRIPPPPLPPFSSTAAAVVHTHCTRSMRLSVMMKDDRRRMHFTGVCRRANTIMASGRITFGPRPQKSAIARSGVTVTRLLCDPLPYENVLKIPHGKNPGENTVPAFTTRCTKRSFPRAVIPIGLWLRSRRWRYNTPRIPGNQARPGLCLASQEPASAGPAHNRKRTHYHYHVPLRINIYMLSLLICRPTTWLLSSTGKN